MGIRFVPVVRLRFGVQAQVLAPPLVLAVALTWIDALTQAFGVAVAVVLALVLALFQSLAVVHWGTPALA